jgi:DNA replication and repair protein RecF
MRLTSLAVENLRCYKLARLELPAGAVALIGENGSGKTTLLEAVYALATGKSFRTPALQKLIRSGNEQARILGSWVKGDERQARQREFQIAAKGTRFLYQDKVIPRGQVPEFLPVVAYCREYLAILTGPPEGRRRFIDRGLLAADPRYFAIWRDAQKATRAKQAALAAGDGALIRAAAQTLIPLAFRLQRARARFVERLSRVLPALHSELGLPETKDAAPLTLRYAPSPPLLQAIEANEPEPYRKALLEALPRERERRMLLRGPQRDELQILWDGRPVAQASGGQQRLALYLLKRAKVEVLSRQYQTPPIFLLDDADAEWDDVRLRAVLHSLAASPGQLLLTAKRREVVKLLPAEPAVFIVENGKIKA